MAYGPINQEDFFWLLQRMTGGGIKTQIMWCFIPDDVRTLDRSDHTCRMIHCSEDTWTVLVGRAQKLSQIQKSKMKEAKEMKVVQLY